MKSRSLLLFSSGAAVGMLLTLLWSAVSRPAPDSVVIPEGLASEAPAAAATVEPPSADLEGDRSAGEPDWLARARAITMPDRREYALPLNNPDVVSCQSAVHMEANDLVVGITHHGHSRAYPWWILSNFHVVNDTIVTNTGGKVPVYIGLCEQCSGAAAFDPRIEELPSRPLIFQVSGIAAGTIEISDVQTLSRWHPFSGEAVSGPLKGRQLEPIPFVMERWDDWKRKHPDSDVVLGGLQMRRRPHGMSHGAQIGHPFLPDFFAKVANLQDKRLPRNALVYGMKIGEEGSALAVRLSDLREEGFLELEHRGTPLLLRLVGDYGVRAFVREREGNPLHFTKDPDDPLVLRDQSGSVWNEMGEAIGGRAALEQAKLRLARGYLTEWYEWVSNATDTAVFNPVRKPNLDLPAITVGDGQGKSFALSRLEGSHAVLIFACATSPLLEANSAELEAVYRDFYKRGVQFYFVYKTLAHPGMSGFVPAFTQEERVMQMRHAQTALGCSIPWLCDNMADAFVQAVSAGDNAELIVDPAGKIIQMREWVDVSQLREDLTRLVGPVANPSNPAELRLRSGRLTPSAPQHVLPPFELPHGMKPLRSRPESSARPYFAKLMAEADPDLVETGTGRLYLGFYLDPIYGGYWNNERARLRYAVTAPPEVTVTPATGNGPAVDKPRDIDPREFLLDVEGASGETNLTVSVTYVVCNDTVPFEETVTQNYAVTLEMDPVANPRQPRLAPQFREGDILAKFLENDKDGSGDLTQDEIPAALRGADANRDGRLDAEEMKKIEVQLLKQQDYHW